MSAVRDDESRAEIWRRLRTLEGRRVMPRLPTDPPWITRYEFSAEEIDELMRACREQPDPARAAIDAQGGDGE